MEDKLRKRKGQHSKKGREKISKEQAKKEPKPIDVKDKSVEVNGKNKSLRRNIKLLILKIIFIVILFYITFFYIFGVTRMKNLAMRPSIEPGSLVIYYRLEKSYVPGDVVTFRKDGKRYVLRIIATANQTVYVNSDKEFIVSEGSEQHRIYFENVIPEESKVTYPCKVGKNQVFVAGDYRTETDDSREFGPIDVDIIDGKVISFLKTKDI